MYLKNKVLAVIGSLTAVCATIIMLNPDVPTGNEKVTVEEVLVALSYNQAKSDLMDAGSDGCRKYNLRCSDSLPGIVNNHLIQLIDVLSLDPSNLDFVAIWPTRSNLIAVNLVLISDNNVYKIRGSRSISIHEDENPLPFRYLVTKFQIADKQQVLLNEFKRRLSDNLDTVRLGGYSFGPPFTFVSAKNIDGNQIGLFLEFPVLIENRDIRATFAGGDKESSPREFKTTKISQDGRSDFESILIHLLSLDPADGTAQQDIMIMNEMDE